jgi:hypothetical protein
MFVVLKAYLLKEFYVYFRTLATLGKNETHIVIPKIFMSLSKKYSLTIINEEQG